MEGGCNSICDVRQNHRKAKLPQFHDVSYGNISIFYGKKTQLIKKNRKKERKWIRLVQHIPETNERQKKKKTEKDSFSFYHINTVKIRGGGGGDHTFIDNKPFPTAVPCS